MDQNTNSGTKQQINVAVPERLISVAAGSYLLVRGLRKFNLFQMAAAGFLLYRGTTGYCAGYKAMGVSTLEGQQNTIEIDTTLNINKPRNEVYNFWRKLENLPSFMKHLESVKDLGQGRSYWVAQIPAQLTKVEWEAQIIDDQPNSRISWSSLPGSTIENSGTVEFNDGYNNQTEVHVTMKYSAPMGLTGMGLARLLNPALEKMVRDDIRNLKLYLETGQQLTKKAKKQSAVGSDSQPQTV